MSIPKHNNPHAVIADSLIRAIKRNPKKCINSIQYPYCLSWLESSTCVVQVNTTTRLEILDKSDYFRFEKYTIITFIETIPSTNKFDDLHGCEVLIYDGVGEVLENFLAEEMNVTLPFAMNMYHSRRVMALLANYFKLFHI